MANTNTNTTMNDFGSFYDKYDIERFTSNLKKIDSVLDGSSFLINYDFLLELVNNPDCYNDCLKSYYDDEIMNVERKIRLLTPYLKEFKFVKDVYDQSNAVLAEVRRLIETKKNENK